MTKKYFTGLNYTLGNEDTSVEIALVSHYKPKNIFAVCGSGGRSLSLASENIEELTLADLSNEQICLAKLREATYKQLSYEDFLRFWGYFPFGNDQNSEARKELFNRLQLEAAVKEMFSRIFQELNYSSLLYLGKWERTFLILAKINRRLLGRDFDRILKFENLDEQRKYYQEKFPHNRWKMVLFLLGNKAIFNALLYKGDFIEKNSADTHFQYYHKAFEKLFTYDLAQKSFFLHLCFYGKINSSAGNPVEASALVHHRINGSKANYHYVTEDLIKHLSSGTKRYDFLSLSDVPSYFRGDLEVDFMQKIRPSLIPGAIVVNRYYLRKAHCNLAAFTDITKRHRDLIDAEKVQMYDICVYQYTP
ncbi:MAG: DUF3419 family protein [Bacteriovorax sp.]